MTLTSDLENRSSENLFENSFRDLPSVAEMYQALVDKNSKYEGVFIAAVRTTGIFCRSTCTARKPKLENVEFFPSTREALAAGYRACKVCRPLELIGATPEWLALLMTEIQNDPGSSFSDSDLRERGLDPVRARRWFLQNHGVTFQAYIRSTRVNKAFWSIRQNEKVINSAYEQGFESLSGFTEAFKKIAGFAPSKSKTEQFITVARIPSPLGPLLAGATTQGLCLMEFTDQHSLEFQIKNLSNKYEATLIPGEHPHLTDAAIQLADYFSGNLNKFTIPIQAIGTDFQKMVWNALMQIPFGNTWSYQDQAKYIGNPDSVRAVARANGDNPISIIIPCHRVIGKNGTLTGYGGGLWRKKFLLDLETRSNPNK